MGEPRKWFIWLNSASVQQVRKKKTRVKGKLLATVKSVLLQDRQRLKQGAFEPGAWVR